MAFDGIVTRAVTKELNDNILNGRVNKIYQPHNTDLLFLIRAKGRTHQLYLSANANFARVQLTKKRYENPKQPPMFCMLLRKHLEGSVITTIEQVGIDRILHIGFETRNEVGDITVKKLIVEIMGKHSNIILIEAENGMILDSIKHLPPSVNRYRTILPGQLYVEPPTQNKINPLDADEETLLKKVDFNRGKIDRQLVAIFAGISPLIARETIHRAGLVTRKSLPTAFFDIMSTVKKQHYFPEMTVAKEKEFFSVVPLTHLDGTKKRFASTSALLDRFFYGKAERDKIKQQAYDLKKILANETNKNKKKLVKLEKTIKESEQADKFQLFGELLTAHMHEVKRGDTSIRIDNYYKPGERVTIPLDPQKTPAENAQTYFKKYNKAKSALTIVQEQIKKTKEEIAYFEQLSQQMESASAKDVEEIREELEEGGYIKRKRKTQRKNQEKPQPERYQSEEGIDIFVGKNNKQNDYLTMKLARKSDTWLHTKDIPGSHVVIRANQFGEETLLAAAKLAAYFSKARNSSNVPVDYTEIRHVRKPNGAKPGYVTYDNQQTVYVTPDEEVVSRLRK